MTGTIPGARRAAFLFLGIAAIWMLPAVAHPDAFLKPAESEFTDLLLAHAPNAFYLRSQWIDTGQIPAWNPNIEGGLPFLADPLSGVWYPPNWLAVLLPPGLGFNLILWLHLAWAGWGMWRLVRSLGSGEAGAWAAGIAFSGAPKILAHVSLGHLGFVCGLSWTPYLLALVRDFIHQRNATKRDAFRAGAFLGGGFGLVFLADPRAGFMVSLIAVPYFLYLALRLRGIGLETAPRWRAIGIGVVVAALAAAGISAALWLPLAEFVSQSVRASLSSAGALALSLPPGNLLQLIVPSASISGEWVAYTGLACLALASIGLVWPISERWFWGSAVLAGWILALGDATPIYPLLAKVTPGMSLVRVPARMLLYSSLGVSVLAGLGLDRLLEGALGASQQRRAILTVSILAVVTGIVNMGLAGVAGGPGIVSPIPAAATIGLALMGLVGVGASLRRPGSGVPLRLGWLALLVVDLAAFSLPRTGVISAQAAADQSTAVISYLAPRASESRLLSLGFDIPPSAAVRLNLRLADGIHPLPLRSYWERMAASLGFDPKVYSVTLPPIPTGDPRSSWTPRINAEELGTMNIGWVVSPYPLSAGDLRLEQVVDGRWIYANPKVRPRAWVQADLTWGGPIQSTARVESERPDELVLHATGPGHLILAETRYPGWGVTVDGRPFAMESYGGLWRAVSLSPGPHLVQFHFRSDRVAWGAALTLLACLGLLIVGASRR
ncbi:MAG: hypothetical protein WD906_04320 [Anaerolineales bacterium]